MSRVATWPGPSASGPACVRLAAARAAQSRWGATPLRQRLQVIREFRRGVADRLDELSATVRLPQRSSVAETIAAELLPLADACRFLEREANRLLGPRRLGSRRRPFWLRGSDAVVIREPYGVVLIVGPSNYPLLLPGVQMLQTVVAGNAVLLKPGRGAAPAAAALADLLAEAGLPAGIVTVLDETVEAVDAALSAGVDLVVLTGSATTGRTVAEKLAPDVTPSIMELSGCDAVFVREDADVDLAAAALRFGLGLNGGYTCIAPRRVFVARGKMNPLERRLQDELRHAPAVAVGRQISTRIGLLIDDAVARGARLSVGERPRGDSMRPLVLADVTPAMYVMHADVAAPLLSLVAVEDDEDALAQAATCGYELGATIFGAPGAATELARRVRAGVVVVNDMIVPTADPRVPFGGRARSGHGVTRGAEGLLQLTRPKTVIRRRGRFRPHYDPPGPQQQKLLASFVEVAHARSFRRRAHAAWRIAKLLARPSSVAGR